MSHVCLCWVSFTCYASGTDRSGSDLSAQISVSSFATILFYFLFSAMPTILGIDNLSELRRPAAATIGNFDGVHLGHEMIVSSLIKASKALSAVSTVVTFDPLAREYFSPQDTLRLMPLEQRVACLETLGVEQVLVIKFDESFTRLSPHEFIQNILVDGLGLAYLSVGDDFRFGFKRAGDFRTLQTAGDQFGFSVQAHDTFNYQGERVSSGRLRHAVEHGDFALAEALLGRPYGIVGLVSQGEQRGRTIGFPTANIELDAERYAVHGVYMVRVKTADQEAIYGIANVGHRPTVAGLKNRLEVHLLDYQGDLYGQQLRVEFLAKLRDEQKFASFADLHKQIQLDAEQARHWLSARHQLS